VWCGGVWHQAFVEGGYTHAVILETDLVPAKDFFLFFKETVWCVLGLPGCCDVMCRQSAASPSDHCPPHRRFLDTYDWYGAPCRLLEQDPTVWCLSAFNDLGKTGNANDLKRLLRTDYFPGLGWMVNKEVWW